MSNRKYFFVISALCALFIYSVSACFSMEEADGLINNSATSLHHRIPDNPRDEINAAVKHIYAKADPKDHELKDVQLVGGWIFDAPERYTPEKYKKVFEFLDELDKAVLYCKFVPLNTWEKVWDIVSKLWWAAWFTPTPFILIPINLMAGGSMFDWLPDDDPWPLYVFATWWSPLFIQQGMNFAESIQQYFYPQGLTPKKPGVNDHKPHIHLHEDLNACRALSLSSAIWDNWPIILYFWWIERHKLASRTYAACLTSSLFLHLVRKDYYYFMNYFSEKNDRDKNNKFNQKTRSMKNLILDWISKMDTYRNSPNSDNLIMAVAKQLKKKESAQEEENKKLDFFIRITAKINEFYSKEINNNEEVFTDICEIMLAYIQAETVTLSGEKKASLHQQIMNILDKNTSSIYDNLPSIGTINPIKNKMREATPRLYHFIKTTISSHKMQVVLEETLRQTKPVWDEKLEVAVYEAIQTALEREPDDLFMQSPLIQEYVLRLKRLINEGTANQETLFHLLLNELYQKAQKTITAPSQKFVNSAFSALTLVPPLNLDDDIEAGITDEPEKVYLNGLKSLSLQPESAENAKKISIGFLFSRVPLRFAFSLWGVKKAFELLGTDHQTAYYAAIGVAGVASIIRLCLDWYPQQEAFASLSHIGKQTDCQPLRWGSKVLSSFPTSLFLVAAIIGIFFEETQYLSWLTYLVLVMGTPTEIAHQFTFANNHWNDIITSSVTSLPMPHCLKVTQERTRQNAYSQNAKRVVENLDEPSTIQLFNNLTHERFGNKNSLESFIKQPDAQKDFYLGSSDTDSQGILQFIKKTQDESEGVVLSDD